MKVSILFPVEIGFDTINVKLTADCNMINTGIGGYDYMGSREYDAGYDVVEVENITWHQYLYTIRENNTIRVAIESDKCYQAFEKAYKIISQTTFKPRRLWSPGIYYGLKQYNRRHYLPESERGQICSQER